MGGLLGNISSIVGNIMEYKREKQAQENQEYYDQGLALESAMARARERGDWPTYYRMLGKMGKHIKKSGHPDKAAHESFLQHLAGIGNYALAGMGIYRGLGKRPNVDVESLPGTFMTPAEYQKVATPERMAEAGAPPGILAGAPPGGAGLAESRQLPQQLPGQFQMPQEFQQRQYMQAQGLPAGAGGAVFGVGPAPATPASLASQEIQGQPTGVPPVYGIGGQLPALAGMPLPAKLQGVPEAMQGLAEAEARRGLRGPEAQAEQEYKDALTQRVIAGDMTSQEANQALHEFITKGVLGGRAAATPSFQNFDVQLPDGKIIGVDYDPKTRKMYRAGTDEEVKGPVKRVPATFDKPPAALLERQQINEGLKDPTTSPEKRQALSERKAQLDANSLKSVLQAKKLQAETSEVVAEGSPDYTVAMKLASGAISMEEMNRMYGRGYSPRKSAVFNTAAQINPNFSPREFEKEFKFASNVQVQNKIAAIASVEANIAHLRDLSDAAARSGAPLLNDYIIPGAINIGAHSYSDWAGAVAAFRDEFSMAIGPGSTTDKVRDLVQDIIDKRLSPNQVNHVIDTIVIPFVRTREESLYNQMGPYAAPEKARSKEREKQLGRKKPVTEEIANQYFDRYGDKAKEKLREDGYDVGQ